MAGQAAAFRPFLLAAAVLAVTAVLLSAIFRFDQSVRFAAVQTELGYWGRDGYVPTPATVRETDASVDALLALNAEHPDYLIAKAHVLAWQAYREDPETAAALYQRAAEYQQAALVSRPTRPQDRLKLVEYRSKVL
jgi:hypothetical protein